MSRELSIRSVLKTRLRRAQPEYDADRLEFVNVVHLLHYFNFPVAWQQPADMNMRSSSRCLAISSKDGSVANGC